MADEQMQDTAVATAPESATDGGEADLAPELEGEEERLPLDVSVEDIGPARKRLTISVPESRISDKLEESFGTFREEAAVPGFRRGRVPRKLVERRYGPSIRDEVKGQILSESYTQALEEQDLEVLGEPTIEGIEDLKLPESGPLTYSVEVEVSPEVKLPPFSELSVTREDRPVTEEDISAEVEKYQERFGGMKEVDDASIEEGDYARCDAAIFEGHIDPPAETDEDAPAAIEHRDGVFVLVPGEAAKGRGHVMGIVVDNLGERMTGRNVGDTVDIQITGPTGHEDERIKNLPITIRLKIDSVQRLEPASVEALMQQAGIESEEELRGEVRTAMTERRKREQQSKLHRQVVEQLLDKVELELPEGLTSRQIMRVRRRQELEMRYEGVEDEQVQSRMAEARQGHEDEARRQLKSFFILDRAARDLEVDVTPGEVNQRVAMMAMQQQRRPEKVRQEMQQRGELEQVYLQIREQKTLDAILEQVGGENTGE